MEGGIDLSSLSNIEFTPSWAKSENKVNVQGGRGEGETKARKPAGERKNFGERKPLELKAFERKSFARAEKPHPLDAEIKILPETKALGTIIRRLQGDVHAYKLKDLAYFFLDNPSSVLLKVSPKDDTRFYQCKACSFAALSEAELTEHIITHHLADYYDAKEVDCEPPKGKFNCVAMCGLSGVWLGPPNIHEFNAVVKEILRTKFPEMSEAEYRSRIEMLRDNDSIEAWRQSAVKKTVYVAKGAGENAVELNREQAEGEFKRNILFSLIDTPKHLMITADKALKSPVKSLVWAVKDALEAERRSPYAMTFALRGAFHHRKLNFFRANDSHGPEFVINQELKEFDASHAIPELKAAAEFLMTHPCCDKSEFPKEGDFEMHLNWLVTTAHAVAFTNGVYSAVEKFPKYGPQWKKREKTKEVVKEVVKEEKKDEIATQLAE